jgi:primosomal protein N' (replication factor Y)
VTDDQLSLGGVSARPKRRRGAPEPAATLPVARVCVDLPLPHLDRPFDYLVPASADADAVPGCRVRVRFAGQLVDGYLLERVESSEHPGRLAYLDRVVSPEPVVAPEIERAARELAARSAGTLADLLRLAVPPRHARAEKAARPDAPLPEPPPVADPAPWARYEAGSGYLGAIAAGRGPRAVWTGLPGEDWPRRIAEAVAACVTSGRGAVVVVPDARDSDRLDAALSERLGPGRHVALSAALGPEERYRRWLAVRRGDVRVAIGTRAAGFAPVADLGLVVLWDDGDDLHVEPRAPYCHAREVLLVRAQLTGAAVLLGSFTRTAEAQQLLQTGWARPLVAPRSEVRAAAPRISPVGDDTDTARDAAAAAARLPTVAWRAARESLTAGAPVLVQVPRRGYLPALNCERCRTPARCTACQGPLALTAGQAIASCRWCGQLAGDWSCPECGSRRLRAAVVGARRTAEELGRAFPGVVVRTSGREEVLARIPAGPALVVATPGAEPVADGGYGAALLLDSWALLTRADLRAGEEALRRWSNAVALVRPAAQGGRVIVHADGSVPVVQALIRSDPGWYAERELAERVELGFPPAVRMASVTGKPGAVADFLALARLPESADTLGPVPVGSGGSGSTAGREGPETERMLLRVPRGDGRALAAALHAAAGVRSARKEADPVRVEVDPTELL